MAAASPGHKLIRLVEVATGNALRTISLPDKGEREVPILFTSDGKTLISGHADGFVRFWEVASGKETRQFRAHSDTLVALALTALCVLILGNGYAPADPIHRVRAVAYSPDGNIRLWEIASGKLLRRIPVQWSLDPDSPVSLLRVATHEFGHILGIPRLPPGNLMDCNGLVKDLAPGDIAEEILAFTNEVSYCSLTAAVATRLLSGEKTTWAIPCCGPGCRTSGFPMAVSHKRTVWSP